MAANAVDDLILSFVARSSERMSGGASIGTSVGESTDASESESDDV